MIKRNSLRRCAVLLVLVAGFASAQSRRAFAPEDIYRLKAVTDPQLSPDGSVVAYVVTTVDEAKNRRLASIWMVPADGSAQPKALISDVPARSPRWSPDGRSLAFISNSSTPEPQQTTPAQPTTAPPQPPPPASGRNQVWMVSRDGSGRHRVTNLPNGVSRFSWSPDGSRLAVVTRTGKKMTDVRHYTSLIDKSDGAGLFDGTTSHIFLVDVKSGTAHQLTSGADHNDDEPEWSPDGNSIAYLSELIGPDLRESVGTSDLMVVPVAGGTPRTIVSRHQYVSAAHWSPDGKQIAYGASPEPAEQPVLWIANADGASNPVLGADVDLFPLEIEWDAAGLWFSAYDRGTAAWFRDDPRTHHAVKILGGERALHNLQIGESTHRLVYLENDDTYPPEVFTSDMKGGSEKQISFHNRELLSRLDLAGSQRVEWKSPDGLAIEGFLKKPVGWQPGQKYPMILAIHGGPNGMFGLHWEIDEQLYAANGYAVFLANPRGSSGYGQKFQRAVAGEWGGKAYQDIISGVDAVIAQNPWIDRSRLGVVGHSYGGFMTNWIVTQTNIFKGAISISGITDFISVEGTRDGAFGHGRDFGGDLFTNFDEYWKYSPLRLSSNVKTPLLFLHGEADQRVPVSQAEEYFRAIKHFGGTAELVIFPKENHGLPLTSEPKHLLETYQWRLYWFDRWVKGNSGATPPSSGDAKQE